MQKKCLFFYLILTLTINQMACARFDGAGTVISRKYFQDGLNFVKQNRRASFFGIASLGLLCNEFFKTRKERNSYKSIISYCDLLDKIESRLKYFKQFYKYEFELLKKEDYIQYADELNEYMKQNPNKFLYSSYQVNNDWSESHYLKYDLNYFVYQNINTNKIYEDRKSSLLEKLTILEKQMSSLYQAIRKQQDINDVISFSDTVNNKIKQINNIEEEIRKNYRTNRYPAFAFVDQLKKDKNGINCYLQKIDTTKLTQKQSESLELTHSVLDSLDKLISRAVMTYRYEKEEQEYKKEQQSNVIRYPYTTGKNNNFWTLGTSDIENTIYNS